MEGQLLKSILSSAVT